MAIAFISGAINNGAGVQTVSVTYSPTAGNLVIVSLGFTVTPSNVTCLDNFNNPLTAGPSLTATITGACFYYTAAAGVTSFTASWTTASGVNIACAEYSGVLGGVNKNLAGNTASGTSATATITVTTEDSNDYIVGALVSNVNVITMTVGTLRENAPAAAAKLKIADNTVASPGAVTLTGTLTSAAWVIVVLELRSVAQAGGASTSNWLTKAVATGVNKH